MHRSMKLMFVAALLAASVTACQSKADEPATTDLGAPTEAAIAAVEPTAPAAAVAPTLAAAPVDASGARTLPSAPAEVSSYQTLESGLQYAVLQEGSGPEAGPGDTVKVHYTGWLEDGTMFDSSLQPGRGEPLSFQLGTGSVIPGWEMGVAGMKVGEKRQLKIPPALAYGASGQGPIPPNSTLIFDVELTGIE
jgi:peptidylprolyl isomerase